MVVRWRSRIHSKKPSKLPRHPIKRPRGMGKREKENIEYKISTRIKRRQVVTEVVTITDFCKKFQKRDFNKT
jgi:hypothetical protein